MCVHTEGREAAEEKDVSNFDEYKFGVKNMSQIAMQPGAAAAATPSRRDVISEAFKKDDDSLF